MNSHLVVQRQIAGSGAFFGAAEAAFDGSALRNLSSPMQRCPVLAAGGAKASDGILGRGLNASGLRLEVSLASAQLADGLQS